MPAPTSLRFVSLRVALAVALIAVGTAACGERDEIGVAAPPQPRAEAQPHADLAPTAAPPVPRLGLWVPCEGSLRVLEDSARVARLVDDARAFGATDLFVQVFRGGRAWFDSDLVEAEPYRAIRAGTGTDTLAQLIELAHAAGLRVHAWVNLFSLATRRDAALLDELGRGIVQVDRRQRSVLEYPRLDVPSPDRSYYRMGTRHVWLDPAAPGLAERLTAIFADLVVRYPGLDGLHFDHVRYPDVLPFSPGSRFGVGLDFGYGEASRARFRRETGLSAPIGDSLANANRWDDWRRERVTEVVRRIAEGARSQRGDLQVSAAVWAYADRAYLALFQDWRGWLDEGLLDFAIPMAYTLDDRLLRYVAHATTGGLGGERVWIGLGAWLFAEQPERLLRQIRLVREASPAGFALFSYDAIAEAEPLREALRLEGGGGV